MIIKVNKATPEHRDYPLHNHLQGKSVVIVGDCNDKGRFLATSLAERGANIALFCNWEASLASIDQFKTAVAARGQQCLMLRGDLSSKTFAEYAVAQVLKRYGRIDVFIHLSTSLGVVSEEQLVVNAEIMRATLPGLAVC
jgi:NAD(P)-dependent dehydrogenase (short-subunit alcohol dehydrogenase family)